MRQRWQNRVSESSWTLPIACVISTLTWWLPGGNLSIAYAVGWLLCALTSYIIIEMNAINGLLRIRSRMVSALFLLWMSACGFLHPVQSGTVIMLCLAVSFYSILNTNSNPQPEVSTFHSYLALSLGSLLWPPFLLLVPVILWNQSTFLRSLTLKSMNAAIIGILLPYLFWGCSIITVVCFSVITTSLNDTPLSYQAAFQPMISHVTAVIDPIHDSNLWHWFATHMPEASWDSFKSAVKALVRHHFDAHPAECVSLICLTLTGVTGFIHYTHKSYDDKIRVRMCHYCFLSMQVVILLWLIIQPTHYTHLFPLLLLTTIPSAAHFIALTHTWLSNSWSIILMLLLVVTAIFSFVLPIIYDWPLPQTDFASPFFTSFLPIYTS